MIVFLVVGRLGKSLCLSKAQPFVASKYVKKVYIFRESEGFKVNGVTYITVPSYILKIKPKFIKKSVRLIFEFFQLLYYSVILRPEIINGIGVKPKGWYSVIVSKLTCTKCIFSIIGGIVSIKTYWRNKRFWEKINLWMIRNSTIVTTKGDVVRKYLIERGINPTKIFILNGSIDIKRFNFYGFNRRENDLLYVGQFRPLKGPDRFIEIVSLIRQKIPDIKAVMLGTGVMFCHIKKEILKRGLNQNITLRGYADDPVKYFQDSKLLVMPSTSEGLPTAMLEAMSCGCVPLVSDVGNIRDAAINDYNSFVISSCFDVTSFAYRAEYLLADEARRSEMASNGRNTVEEKYSIEKQTLVVDQIIEFMSS